MSRGGALDVFHRPGVVAVVGASDHPDKIGGRPLRYLREFGFAGRVLPVNPTRQTVQGLQAFPDVASLPVVPDLAVIAVGGENGVAAVEQCAALGVRGCVVMASGFGETGDPVGAAQQHRMVSAARSTGMRMVGPNAIGLANFADGAVFGFSTMFVEEPPLDGPIAIVSQSGAMSAVPYGLLRRRGLGVRYCHGTGNDADVGVADLLEEVVRDPAIRVALLYIEDIRDPSSLRRAARTALENGVAIIALMGGRSADGQRAAQSHTGALANEHRVVDAVFARLGIWRARSVADQIRAVELYLRDWAPRGSRLAVVSNSGAVCVLAADAAAEEALPLADLSATTVEHLTAVLPSFATKTNPVDVTAALLTDSSLFGKVLPALATDSGVDACFIGIPVSGEGYDIDLFATDIARFGATSGRPVVVATPQPSVAAKFRAAGLVVFEEEANALGALSQFLRHCELLEQARSGPPLAGPRAAPGPTRSLSEIGGLHYLASLGIDAVPTVLCSTAAEAAAAFVQFGGRPVVVKGCPSVATHKSELGLVELGLTTADQAEAAAAGLLRRMADLELSADGVIVAPMVPAVTEAFVGAHVDAVFGPVVMVGAGGKYVEALDDVIVLLPPFSPEQAAIAIGRLRIAPLLDGIRGDPPSDVSAWARAAVRVGDAFAADPSLVSVDVNPLLLGAQGSGQAIAADALVVRAESMPPAPGHNNIRQQTTDRSPHAIETTGREVPLDHRRKAEQCEFRTRR
jgi:acyl-CoA synthetase (NDP forming)